MGVSFFGRLFWVTLPTIKTALFAACVLTFTLSMGEFNVSFFLYTPLNKTLAGRPVRRVHHRAARAGSGHDGYFSTLCGARISRFREAGYADGGRRMSFLDIKSVNFFYGDTQALFSVSLDISKSELVTLVGPSGCGKSTLLRVVAGLLEPRDGKVIVDGEDMTRVPPEQRRVGWVPQSYALFEHLNVVGERCVRAAARAADQSRLKRARGRDARAVPNKRAC